MEGRDGRKEKGERNEKEAGGEKRQDEKMVSFLVTEKCK